MSEETRCPSCETGNLYTPIIRYTGKDKRKVQSLPFKICRHCNFVIDPLGIMNYQIKGEIIHASN